MTDIALLTDEEVSGIGIGPEHGPAMTRLNAIITALNARVTAGALVDLKLVQVVITAVGGVGGSTAGTISVQVNDLAGQPIERAVNLRLLIADTEGAGSIDAASTCQFGSATTGTLIAGSGGAVAAITTDATGLYEGALANAADETNYFSAESADGGAAALVNGCVVAGCAIASAEWAA